jgi:hypothetical protein
MINAFKSMYAIDNDIFQWARKQTLIALRNVSRKVFTFSKQNKVLAKKVMDSYKSKHGISKFSEHVVDRSGKMFESMYKTTKAIYKDSEGNEQLIDVRINQLHVDANDPETAAAKARGEITDAHIEYGAFIWKSFEEKMRALIRHELEFGSSKFLDSRTGKVLEPALLEAVDKEWERSFGQKKGVVPFMRVSAAQSLFSGNVKQAWSKTWDDVSNPNKVWDQDYDLEAEAKMTEIADRFKYQFNNDTPYGSLKVLNQMGLDYVDGQLMVTDPKQVSDFSTDISLIMDLYVRNIERKIILERDALPALNSGLMMLDRANRDAGVDESGARDILQKFKDRVIHGRMDETGPLSIGNIQVGNTTVDADTAISMAKTIAANTALAFSLPVAITSFTSNLVNLEAFAMKNSATNSDLFGIKDLHRAMGVVTKFMKHRSKDAEQDFRKYVALMEHLQVAKYSEDDVTGLPLHQPQKQMIWQSHYLHYMNWTSDMWARGTVGIAQMMKDGVWEAYTLNADGELVYDEKKDGRLYKDGQLTEDGKLLRASRREALIEQGLQDPNDEKLSRAYDEREAITLKAIADKYIMGSFDKTTVSTAESSTGLVAMLQFRKFLTDRVHNKFGRTMYQEDLGKRVVVTTADGKKEVVWQDRLVEGQFTSVAMAWNEIMLEWKGISKAGGTIAAWKKLPKERRENIAKLMIDIGLWSSLFLTYHILTGGFDDEDEDPILKETRLSRSVSNGFADLVGLLNPQFYNDLYKNPIPVFSSLQAINEVVFQGNLEAGARFIPGRATVNSITETININEPVNSEK